MEGGAAPMTFSSPPAVNMHTSISYHYAMLCKRRVHGMTGRAVPLTLSSSQHGMTGRAVPTKGKKGLRQPRGRVHVDLFKPSSPHHAHPHWYHITTPPFV
eukprot:624859-Pelagomonas_calceolata.AAC.7